MCGKKHDPPPPLPPPPPPPPPSPANRGNVSKGKSKTKTIASKALTHQANDPPHKIPPNNGDPLNASGRISFQQVPRVEFQKSENGGPGYISFTGGQQIYSWHKYDVSVPIPDFMSGDPAHQANLIHAMMTSQMGSSNHPICENYYHHSIPTRAALGHRELQAASATALTEANVANIVKKPSTDRAMTSVSRNPPNPRAPPTKTCAVDKASNASGSTAVSTIPITAAAPSTKPFKHRCLGCGQSKKVTELRSGAELCWECGYRLEGSDFVRSWLRMVK